MAKKRTKKFCLGHRVAGGLGALVLVAALLLMGARYSSFVSQTVYQESVSHLGELLRQSCIKLNVLARKSITYLHLMNQPLSSTTGEDRIQAYLEEARKEAGFSQFYFLTSEGNFMTPEGETGYLGLQGNLEDHINRGGDIIMTAVLPGKPQLLVFACPEHSGVYRGFAYDAIAIAYSNKDVVALLDTSSFDDTSISYVVHADGRVIIDSTGGSKEPIYNLLAMLRDYSDLSEESKQALIRDFQEGASGNCRTKLGGVQYYVVYEPTTIEDWVYVGLVPADVVNAGMNELQSRTVLLVASVVLCAAALVIYVILRKNRATLRRKDREILYREELFEKLSRNVDDVFLMLDPGANRVDYVSPNAQRLLGLPAEVIQTDIRILDRLNPENQGPQKKDYLEGLQKNEQREMDHAYIHQETHERRWFHVVALGTEVDGQRKIILVLSDRTEDKRKNEALREAVSAAESANRAKSTFLSNMSHDIRTPMNAIVGFATLASNNVADKEKVRDYLGKILSASNHLLSLINDILDMSRIESGKLQLEETEVNLSQVYRELETIVSAQVSAKGQTLSMARWDVSDENVSCDKTRLNQVLLNLLSNAVKFTPEGGTVSLALRQLPGNQKGRGTYEFRVRDNGIGMSPEFAKKIFEPFERERTSTVSRTQGTGLGMAISKSIVDMMGGTIEVHSQPQKGTEFIVRLPLTILEPQAAPKTAQKQSQKEETPDFTGKRILLAEDNELNREIAVTILSQFGFTVDPVENGAEAVARLRSVPQGTYDLVLMDMQMPIMDGCTATRLIRETHNPIPILAMTANAFEEDRKRALDAGMDGFLTKPIVVGELIKAVGKAVKPIDN